MKYYINKINFINTKFLFKDKLYFMPKMNLKKKQIRKGTTKKYF